MFKSKWHTLRMLFIVALSMAHFVTRIVKTHYHYPVEWLLHYLKGTGKAKEVPPFLFQRAASAIANAMAYKNDGYMYDKPGSKIKYCLFHSTLYEGRGFADRPSLFYLIGGFSFTIIKPRSGWLDMLSEDCFLISGSDVYDWHPNAQGFYFDSPLGNNIVIKWAVLLLGKIYGEEYFHISTDAGVNEGNACLSNKIWETLGKYGAKSLHRIGQM